ncbi:MAG: hypothetical protein ACRDZQ_11220 [Acidimicrobiales bacterium]
MARWMVTGPGFRSSGAWQIHNCRFLGHLCVYEEQLLEEMLTKVGKGGLGVHGRRSFAG